MKTVTTAFKENKEFITNQPWSFTKLTYPTDNIISPPHYAETIEVLIYTNVKGDIHIGGQHFEVDGNKAFFIMPNMVHSMYHKKSDGFATVIKINPDELRPILDLDQLLSRYNCRYEELPIALADYEKIKELADDFINAKQLIDGVCVIAHFFKALLDDFTPSDKLINHQNISNNEFLYSVIKWTEQNFQSSITLDKISAIHGYSRHYFCKKFKTATGITYLSYLNNLRIYEACKLLKTGHSIPYVCGECGFDDLSYFTQLFKKITDTTPKKYASQFK